MQASYSQTNKFSVTSFHVASVIFSSKRATLPMLSIKNPEIGRILNFTTSTAGGVTLSTLVQKLDCKRFNKLSQRNLTKTCKSIRPVSKENLSIESKLSPIVRRPAVYTNQTCHEKLLCIHTRIHT